MANSLSLAAASGSGAQAQPQQLVQSKDIKAVQLLSQRDARVRLDRGPFQITYALAAFQVVVLLMQGRSDELSTFYLYIGGIIAVNVLLKLFMHWNVDVHAYAAYTRARTLQNGTHIKVVPTEYNGTKEIVPISTRRLDDGKVEVAFDYRKQKFVYDPTSRQFHKLKYPTHETFGHYQRASGFTREAAMVAAKQTYGGNQFDMPLPRFMELLKEQMLAPFFVFQVFCVGLWCLDEFWYYSLFTLGMLVVFESTVVTQRIKSLKDLRAMQTPKQHVHVYRFGKWDKVPGEELLPGDIISIGRPSGPGGGEDQVVPADALLLTGTCITDEAILTGESTPQWKSPAPGGSDNDGTPPTSPVGGGGWSELDMGHLHVKRDKVHVLFGGTKVLQHTADKGARIRTPDGGCLTYVLRTGFETAQGRLMRMILHSTERVTANNWETGFFILFLLIFAIAASAYVLIKGLENGERSRFKLYLNCTMIITSVIPPELPMELSIAVNTSLLALARKAVFCTEPFRIPFGGKVTVCCFDKTGTLTTDNMLLQGIAGLMADVQEVVASMGRLPIETVRVLVGCHSLVTVDGEVVGDPLERAAAKATGWSFGSEAVSSPKLPGGLGKETVAVLQRHMFSSSLKRMSAAVKVDNEAGSAGGSGLWVVAKGAPEVLQGMLGEVPGHYERTYKHFASMGARVICLAYKRLPQDVTPTELRSMPRDEVESGLVFGGFAIFHTPLKPDSAPALSMLADSKHQLVMITGDAPLTACHAAGQVHIVTRPVLIMTHKGHSQKASNLSHKLPSVLEPDSHYEWVAPDETVRLPFVQDWDEVLSMAEEYDLCITGDGLAHIQQLGEETRFIPLAQVFARVSPEQKETILKALRAVGGITLMCGDGTNDVGALKAAHVGIALLAPAPKKADKAGGGGGQGGAARPTSSGSAAPALTSSARGAAREGRGGAAGSSSGGRELAANGRTAQQTGPPKKKGPGTKMIEELQRRGKPVDARMMKMAEWMDSMEDTSDAPMVKPGDASMAAPFTAKQDSVMPCTDVIKQGRCTLVTMVQMFKILGLLCLSSAYSLSVMYLDGVKLGDVQATMQGFLTAGLFFCISNAKPLKQLSSARPHPNIFCVYLFASLLGQFAAHIGFLVTMYRHAVAAMPQGEKQAPDTDFQPNLVNTVCFLVQFVIQIITFSVNYVGHPFNTSIAENKGMFTTLKYGAVAFAVLVVDPFGLGELVSLVPIPNQLQMEMCLGAFAVFLGTLAWERLLRRAFPAALPPAKGYMMFKRGGRPPKKLKAA